MTNVCDSQCKIEMLKATYMYLTDITIDLLVLVANFKFVFDDINIQKHKNHHRIISSRAVTEYEMMKGSLP